MKTGVYEGLTGFAGLLGRGGGRSGNGLAGSTTEVCGFKGELGVVDFVRKKELFA